MAKNATSAGTGLTKVRRPTRGIEIKDDTHAYIKLIRVDGVEIPIFDSSAEGGTSTAYSNFILQAVQEQRMEKHQIVETFGDTYLFMFGESPRFLNIQAMLINSLDFNWKAEFLANYEKYLRGTKCVEMGARTYLFYDQNIIEGYILNCQLQETADTPHVIPLSFQFFVTNSSNISLIETDQYPIRSSANVPEGVELTDDLGGEALEQLVREGGIAQESSFLEGRFDRERPIRSLILDNTDEYTTGLQPSLMEIADERVARALQEQRQREQELKEALENLEAALADLLYAYGVDEDEAQDPFLMDDLGVGPTFLPAGVGIGSSAGQAGAFATFGANASVQAGAFAGGGAGIGARAGSGFSSFSGAYAGVSASAFAGTSAGGSAFGATSTRTTSFRTSVLASARANASFGGSVTAFASVTGRAGGRASAFASMSASARAGAGASASSFATSNARAAARAGGYASAGAYLGFNGYSSFSASSFAGGQGAAGASVNVGGRPTAFAFVAAKGSIRNVGQPPSVAVQQTQRNYSWQKSWTWPTPN